jgi:hypothetical protein
MQRKNRHSAINFQLTLRALSFALYALHQHSPVEEEWKLRTTLNENKVLVRIPVSLQKRMRFANRALDPFQARATLLHESRRLQSLACEAVPSRGLQEGGCANLFHWWPRPPLDRPPQIQSS